MKSEFEFIKGLRNHFNLLSIGDDCAVLPKDENSDLLITADLLVEEVDFRLQWASPGDIGHKSLAVSLSDVAAMGGRPTSALVSIGIPRALWDTGFLDEFYEGYLGLAKEYDVELIGGDISKTPDRLVVDSIVLGETKKGRAVMRSTACPDDLIFVTGKLGLAKLGLALLESGRQAGVSGFDEPLRRQLTPIPRIRAALELTDQGVPTSMIDLSDGLSSDLLHLCEASGVGARIYADKIPVADYSVTGIDSLSGALDAALNGGEDFELLFTVNPNNNYGTLLDDYFQIGEINKNAGRLEIVVDGNARPMPALGYTHF